MGENSGIRASVFRACGPANILDGSVIHSAIKTKLQNLLYNHVKLVGLKAWWIRNYLSDVLVPCTAIICY